MSKQPTINSQITDLTAAIEANDYHAARELVAALSDRRLRGDAAAVFPQLVEMFEAMEQPETNMSKQLAKYRVNYKLTISASGSKSLSNGDGLAKFLEGKDEIAVMFLADDATGVDRGWHAAKYANLNTGAKRMNAGNKLRARWLKGEWSIPGLSQDANDEAVVEAIAEKAAKGA